uniref:Ethanolamine kinase n=1 Tax=Cacopsylla melanoneura TaxID=428564 RepID=A0A8D8RYV4_9HEMI
MNNILIGILLLFTNRYYLSPVNIPDLVFVSCKYCGDNLPKETEKLIDHCKACEVPHREDSTYSFMCIFCEYHRAGLAHRLYAEFDNGLVYDYVRGVTTNPDTIRLPHIYPLVARTMARLHKVHSNMKHPKLWNLGKLMLSLIPRQ